MTISFQKFGSFNDSRIKKFVDSSNKKEALSMGMIDKFKDLFKKVEDKKITKLGALYDALISNLDKPGNNSNIKTSNIDKILIFNELQKMADEDSQDKFSCELSSDLGVTNQLNFIIDNIVVSTVMAKPLDKYIIAKLNNNPEILNTDLLKSIKHTESALTKPINQAFKHCEETIRKFIHSRTAMDPEPYKIKRDYIKLSSEIFEALDTKLDKMFNDARSINEYVQSLDANKLFNYGNCSTQALYLSAKLLEQGFDTSIHEIVVKNVPHTTTVARSKEGVYLLDPWTGNNEDIPDINFFSKKHQEKILKFLCPTLKSDVRTLLNTKHQIMWGGGDAALTDDVEGAELGMATIKQWNE